MNTETTISWFQRFLVIDPKIQLGPVPATDNAQISSLTTEHVCKHIAHIDAAPNRFDIQDLV